MRLKNLKIKGFKNLTGPGGWFEIDFDNKNGITVLVGNNGSGKSNVVEAISAIFAGLYDKKQRPDFNYQIAYEINGKDITIEQAFTEDAIVGLQKTGSKKTPIGMKTNKIHFVTHNISKGKLSDFLPSRVITAYSGEETRLYENYYKKFYDDFVDRGIKDPRSETQMIFVSKSHWEIALLALLVSDYSLEDILGERVVKSININFNKANIEKFIKSDPASVVNNFAKNLIDEGNEIDFENFKNIAGETHYELYKRLAISLLHKEGKNRLFNAIDIVFDDDTKSSELSEGEKKQILIYFIFELLVDKDSLVLLDEPDSYIHIGNKERLKDFFEKFREDFENEGEIIITTHSPTLMHYFDDKHLVYLENGQIAGMEKRKILDEITAGKISYTETEIFLNSKKPILLVTEGVTDVKHIKLAAEKLGIDLEFDIYDAGSAEKLTKFLIGVPGTMFLDKKVIGIFDYDEAGIKALKKVGEQLVEYKKYKVKDAENIFAISLPCPDIDLEEHENCPIEFLYPVEKIENLLIKKTLGDANKKFPDRDKLNQRELDAKNDLCFYKISESDTSKNDFAEKCKAFEVTDFEGFRALFDLILEIKNQ